MTVEPEDPVSLPAPDEPLPVPLDESPEAPLEESPEEPLDESLDEPLDEPLSELPAPDAEPLADESSPVAVAVAWSAVSVGAWVKITPPSQVSQASGWKHVLLAQSSVHCSGLYTVAEVQSSSTQTMGL